MTDRYRPLFHFTAPTGWINDPNGLIYFEGEYHLFYQHIPLNSEGVIGEPFAPHWGHAVSPDLVRWTHLPIALYPDSLGAIYSGSAVVDWEDRSGFFGGRPGLVAVFTHHNVAAPPHGPEVQSLAYSADRGRTWITYAHNPVLANPGVPDFRDPKVFWHAPTRRWVMVVAFDKNRVRFYVSGNLRDWTHVGEFGEGQGAQGAHWECPDLFELPVDGDPRQTRWVLNVSTYHATSTSNRVGMQYFIGDFDGTTFTNANAAGTVLSIDQGRDNYAAVTWSDLPATDGRRIMLGWMNDWTYARVTPTAPWRGAMTLPRELLLRHLDAGVRLIQRPVAELERLRGQRTHWSDHTITPDTGLWHRDIGDALELVMTIRPGSATECGVRVVSGEHEQTTIGYDMREATLFIDRTRSGKTDFKRAFPGRHGGPLSPANGAVTLRIFLDRSSVEVFGNDGECVVTSLIYPESGRSGLQFYALDGPARLVSLEIYHLHAP
jgi:fructan beta-fructosidase